MLRKAESDMVYSFCYAPSGSALPEQDVQTSLEPSKVNHNVAMLMADALLYISRAVLSAFLVHDKIDLSRQC